MRGMKKSIEEYKTLTDDIAFLKSRIATLEGHRLEILKEELERAEEQRDAIIRDAEMDVHTQIMLLRVRGFTIERISREVGLTERHISRVLKKERD